MMTTVEQVHKMLESRANEIDSEKKRIKRALDALGSNGGGSRSQPRKMQLTKGPKRRGTGRKEQALRLIENNPGISAAGIAAALRIKPNYLYRILGDLTKEGCVKKDGRTYSPAS